MPVVTDAVCIRAVLMSAIHVYIKLVIVLFSAYCSSASGYSFVTSDCLVTDLSDGTNRLLD